MKHPESTHEEQLCLKLGQLAQQHKFCFTPAAHKDLIQSLFWSCAGGNREYLKQYFFHKEFDFNGVWSLSEAQTLPESRFQSAPGAVCGHIFKNGEAAYHCRTCALDDTCALCSNCFESTNHEGHRVKMNMSIGNGGCCDCGDDEAWTVPLNCSIHVADRSKKGKQKAVDLPQDLVNATRMTISRVVNFLCDIISCSPEQLRSEKTVDSVRQDEVCSRLPWPYTAKGDEDYCGNWSLIIWNDEKHSVDEVKNQVARACKLSRQNGRDLAHETDRTGRAIVKYHDKLKQLLRMARVIEQINLTVTVRSSRDTFREQMCGAIVDWLRDIATCKVGDDHMLLRRMICEEFLLPWNPTSRAIHSAVGANGVFDEDRIAEDSDNTQWAYIRLAGINTIVMRQVDIRDQQAAQPAAWDGGDYDDDDDNNDDDDVYYSDSDNSGSRQEVTTAFAEIREMMHGGVGAQSSGHMAEGEANQSVLGTAHAERTGQAASPANTLELPGRLYTPSVDASMTVGTNIPAAAPALTRLPASQTGGHSQTSASQRHSGNTADVSFRSRAQPGVPRRGNYAEALKIPQVLGSVKPPQHGSPGKYWMVPPPTLYEQDGAGAPGRLPSACIDWMILFDLRMWKHIRDELRNLYISTVVTIPEFKRILGVRFAGLYTILAQLYLIADREPDHSIVTLSLQILTTPSITAEVVDRGHFLTNLLAIIYTFMANRQVAHPWEVNPNASVAFDSPSVGSRRMCHFIMDLKMLFRSPHVRARIRQEPKYMMQFLDLIKLLQGICPNVRATTEHLEWEMENWSNANTVTRDINKLCRQVALSFAAAECHDEAELQNAIRLVAKSVIINSIGAERLRFTPAEIKEEVKFKILSDFEFEPQPSEYKVVKFVVEKQPVSFQHALHYTLSWLIECAKDFDVDTLRQVLTFTAQDLLAKPQSMGTKVWPDCEYLPEDYLMAAFDYPLRACVLVTQIKAGMWVRNGTSLRHQAVMYRNMHTRGVSYMRDVFLLQVALVICNPSRVLISIVDRYGLESWIKGIFEVKAEAQDDLQHLDVVEEMLHLLIVLLSDRISLLCAEDEPNPRDVLMRRDIVHALFLQPLVFSELCHKVPYYHNESPHFESVVDEMTIFKRPDGMADQGLLALRPEYAAQIEPYSAHFSKSHREEAEASYKKLRASVTGQSAEDVVYEPQLREITRGVFTRLADFTCTGIFSQIIFYCLLYPMHAERLTPTVPMTRIESYLQLLLHLVLIAVNEDKTSEDSMLDDYPSFIHHALTTTCRGNGLAAVPDHKTIVSMLALLLRKESFKACHSKIALILRRMKEKRPRACDLAFQNLGIADVDKPASIPADIAAEKERKKKAALARHAKVMAQFQEQQKNFMAQEDIEWDDVNMTEDNDGAQPHHGHVKMWKYPHDRCILCQEDTDERRLFGAFTFFTTSNMFRLTNLAKADQVEEVLQTPASLDRSADDIRPFGIARKTHKMVTMVNAAGESEQVKQQVIGRGFSPIDSNHGPVAVGCGHMMHYSCFENYVESIDLRHRQQIARCHPENRKLREFVCPLCRALNNAFLPVLWKGKEESYPGMLQEALLDPSFKDTVQHVHTISTASVTSMPNDTERRYAQFGTFNVPRIISNRYVNAVRSHNLSSLASSFVGELVKLENEIWHRPPGRLVTDVALPRPLSHELLHAYNRLRGSFAANRLVGRCYVDEDPQLSELSFYDSLTNSIGFTITAVEIQQRGVEAQHGMSFLSKVPEQTLIQLRILCETAWSYIYIMTLRQAGREFRSLELSHDVEWQLRTLFNHQYFEKHNERHHPLLSQDTFVFLCQAIYGLGPSYGISTGHLVILCYMAELVKVGLALTSLVTDSYFAPGQTDESDTVLQHFASFVDTVAKMRPSSEYEVGLGNGTYLESFTDHSLRGCYDFARRYALIFIRKVAVLLYVNEGVDLNSHFSTCADADELERLTELLRLPSFDTMCSAIVSDAPQSLGFPWCLKQMAADWVYHQWFEDRPRARGFMGTTLRMVPPGLRIPSDEELPRVTRPWLRLNHPGIFELLGLPVNYGVLVEEATQRRCPTLGGEMVEAAICLFCGEIFCTQSVCCAKKDDATPGGAPPASIGGAQQHMRRCQGNVGLTLHLRKCNILCLYGRNGGWAPAPYLDKYGETDQQMRRGLLLRLAPKRYDLLARNLWLSNGIPSFVARRLEAEINAGGWETI